MGARGGTLVTILIGFEDMKTLLLFLASCLPTCLYHTRQGDGGWPGWVSRGASAHRSCKVIGVFLLSSEFDTALVLIEHRHLPQLDVVVQTCLGSIILWSPAL
eukprot:TRINITY_DN11182_c0_g1_i2.p1 TRINITY_DN11182_c0_g1~~TRINITY_DN11182_c0_g1_i2.p1  ORF type:complete len:103 (-),score=9.12 TRINITY_DN11182_c0_g1_i2:294-602(-)